MLDWEKRIKNKAFWVALVPSVLLLIQVLAVPFGYKFDIAGLNKDLLDIVNAIFSVLAVLGVVIDPTTSGVSDQDTIEHTTTPSANELIDDDSKGA